MRDKNGWTGAPRFLFQPVKGGFRILQELTLFGEIDRVQTAIDRLRMLAPNAEANHPGGLMVCDSGGKDSDVIKELARLAGVRFEIAHSHTTADHPLTVRYVREEQARWRALGVSYTIIYPTFKGKSTSMWALIPIKGAPMRQRRWCCDLLKETAGAGRYTVTGVRWAESANRKQRRATYELPSGKRERIKLNNDNDLKRRMTEFCMKRGKVVVNPIIDWQDADVWEFHDLYHLPHNPLYDLGYKRVGCIGCPMALNLRELDDLPEYKALYIRSFQRYLDLHPEIAARFHWQTGADMFRWWITRKGWEDSESGQLDIEEYLTGLVVIQLINIADSVQLCIKNPVASIPTEEYSKLLERFYVADVSRSNGTSGQGLYIVKKLLLMMNCTNPIIEIHDHNFMITIDFSPLLIKK